MAMVEDRIGGLEQRMAKVEGILEQMSLRLNHVEERLDHLGKRLDQFMVTKADKWEVRIWFVIITTLLGFILAILVT